MTKWYDDIQNQIDLAKWLVGEGRMATGHAVIQIFEKPWKWTAEFEEYQKATAEEGTK